MTANQNAITYHTNNATAYTDDNVFHVYSPHVTCIDYINCPHENRAERRRKKKQKGVIKLANL